MSRGSDIRRGEPDEFVRAGLVASPRSIRQLRGRHLLLLPALVYLLVLYLLPVARLLSESVWDEGRPSLRPLAELVAHPEFLNVFRSTFEIALGVTLIAVILGYPVAYYLTRLSGRLFAVAILCIMFPLLTSVLVRTFAWIALLGRMGLINELLSRVGVIHTPLSLLFNRTGVYIGLVHVLLPFAILPIYGVMTNIDRNVLKAATSLGAPPARVFLQVYLPLSFPGVAAGGLLVFIMAVSSYITPAVLGGTQDMMIANLIGEQIESALNWKMGGALSLILLALSVPALVAYLRFGGERSYRA